MSTINPINLPDLSIIPPKDESEKTVNGKWQYTVIYRDSTVLQKIVDTIVALVTTIFTFGFYRGKWSDVFHGREREIKFEQIDVKDHGGNTTILLTYKSTKTLKETAKVIALTVFTLGIGLAFKRTREMWSAAFYGQKEEHDVEHAIWYAADWGKWDLVKKILTLNPKVNINAAPAEGRFAGQSALWIATICRQWNLVEKILEKHPEVDVNAAPTHGIAAGESVLWLAASCRKWEVVKNILETHPEANVNAATTLESYTGGSVLWYVAKYKQWSLVEKILEKHPKADVNAAPSKGQDVRKSVLCQLAKCKQWGLVKKILKTHPEADVNAAPTKGKHAGKSVLWWANFHGKRDIVKKMKEKLSKANV